MAGRKKDRGLGRGLSALMNDLGATEQAAPVSDDALETKSAKPPAGRHRSARSSLRAPVDAPAPDRPAEQPGVSNVAISRLVRNPDQPRRHFARDAMDDLVASIQQKGVLQPVLVRPLSDAGDGRTGKYQIVAGERRWQAATQAGLTSIPIIVRKLSDRDVLEIGVIENVQRADLNPMEEALAYEKLLSEFGRTQTEIATTIGKSRAHVANMVRLTKLPARARELVASGALSAGHARAVLAAEDPAALTEAIVREDYSVRQAEDWVRAEGQGKSAPPRIKVEKSADIRALEQKIQDRTGFKADIRHKGKGGEMRLRYRDLADMEDLLRRLGSA